MAHPFHRLRSTVKFSPSFFLFILLGGAATFYFIHEQKKEPIPIITEGVLIDKLKKKEVKRILLYKGKNRVGIFIQSKKKKKATAGGWKDFFLLSRSEEPDYILPILSSTNFDSHWIRIKEQLPNPYRIEYEIIEPSGIYSLLESLMLLLLLLFLFMFFGGFLRGNKLFSIGKSRAKLWEEKEAGKKTDFSDVAGLHEAKQEVVELVDFLKHPLRFLSIGARLPKGVLFVGPPGTGKTLLARAVASSAKARFYYMSGSDFQGMIVGAGVSRMRDLFMEARKQQAPVILFIDEIESIGRKRGGSITSTSEDREYTLNTFLTEVDGIKPEEGYPILVIGATNFPEVLDAALLRRLERKVVFELPALKDREEIFRKHLEKVKKSSRINFTKLAEQTAGFSGSDIASSCNEGAIHAVIKRNKQVTMADIEVGIDRIATGRERKSKRLSLKDKRRVAVHEAGHALACWFDPLAPRLLKLTIIPRMHSLGHLQQKYPEQYILTEQELRSKIFVALGGMAAEHLRYGNRSTGARSDLEQVTTLAKDIITLYGMNTKVGYVSYKKEGDYQQLVKPYSDATSQLIDEEARALVNAIYKKVEQLLLDKKKELDALVALLLKKESLGYSEVASILGESVESIDIQPKK